MGRGESGGGVAVSHVMKSPGSNPGTRVGVPEIDLGRFAVFAGPRDFGEGQKQSAVMQMIGRRVIRHDGPGGCLQRMKKVALIVFFVSGERPYVEMVDGYRVACGLKRDQAIRRVHCGITWGG